MSKDNHNPVTILLKPQIILFWIKDSIALKVRKTSKNGIFCPICVICDLRIKTSFTILALGIICYKRCVHVTM